MNTKDLNYPFQSDEPAAELGKLTNQQLSCPVSYLWPVGHSASSLTGSVSNMSKHKSRRFEATAGEEKEFFFLIFILKLFIGCLWHIDKSMKLIHLLIF